jgi:hypothetical protein
MGKGWSLLGHFDPKAKNSVFGMALAVFIAAETFGAHDHRYKLLMSLLVLISGVFIGAKAYAARSITGLLTLALSLIWSIPLVNKNFFYSLDLTFMLAHSALALLVAVGAFTYLKN